MPGRPADHRELNSRALPDDGDQLHAIESVTDLSIRHLDVDDLLDELLARVAGLLHADTAAVLLLDSASQQLIARAAWGVEEEVRQGVKLRVGYGFAGRVAATRKPVALDRVDASTVANPLLWEKGIQAMLGVPLLSGDELLGVLHVGCLTQRRFTDTDANLLSHVAGRVAAAIQARELEAERAAARVVQHSLLPTRLPDVPGVRFDTRYVPAEKGGVGGDWYDAFMTPTGTLWIMLGDVAGHGLRAAVVMGRLRSSLQCYALDGGGPEDVLSRADRKLQLFEPEETATVLCAALDPPYDVARISLAGHPPPVFASDESPPGLVDITPDLPLGVDLDLPRTSTTVSLPEGSVLVAYTDGLVERRGRSLDEGLALLCRAVDSQAPERVCHSVMDTLVGREAAEDDIAVFTVWRGPAGTAT